MLALMHSDLEKLVSRGKLEASAAEKLESLPPGTYCHHKSWGPGKVADWDRLNLKVIVDFIDKPGHALAMKFAATSLTAVAEDSFYGRLVSSPDELSDMAKSEPAELVKLALLSADGSMSLDQLEGMVKGSVVADGKYKSWWDSTKKKLKTDRQFVVPAKRTENLELRDSDIEPTEALIEDFRSARDLKSKSRALDAIIKDIQLYNGSEEMLFPVLEEITDTARKGAKLQFIPAVELILAREELRGKLKGGQDVELSASVSDVLGSNLDGVPELLETLPLGRMRQALRALPEAYGDDWKAKTLDLIAVSNLRTIGEIAAFLNDSDEKKMLTKYVQDNIQQRTITSDGLAWVCKERKGLASDIFDTDLSPSIMSSLEADQLNEEGAVRAANRLRDLIADDKELIPDLIDGANINTVRNFASRLLNSASFDELTRKSLFARIIKLNPQVQDLLSRSSEAKEEVLIVSEESLERRKEDYRRLIHEEIPQNREDIKIARSYGDLRENFEYKSAKDFQRVLMKRQSDLERDLKIAKPTQFENPDTNQASIGTVVGLSPVGAGKPLTYTILGAWDTDPDKGIIPYLSERAKEILEKSVGDTVTFTSESGEKEEYKLESIAAYQA